MVTLSSKKGRRVKRKVVCSPVQLLIAAFLSVILIIYLVVLRTFSISGSPSSLKAYGPGISSAIRAIERKKDSAFKSSVGRLRTEKIAASLARKKRPSSEDAAPKKKPFIVSFMGDTMINPLFPTKNQKDATDWTVETPLSEVRQLLKKSDYAIINLEGPVTTLGIEHDPKHKKPSYSFNMDPSVAVALKKMGVKGAGMANNHYFDRGSEGIEDTLMHTKNAGLESFGLGQTRELAAKPLLIETPMGVTLGVTGFCDLKDYHKSARPPSKEAKGVLGPKKEDAKLAIKEQRKSGADFKIAFVHWGKNYEDSKALELRKRAEIFADAGFDLIIGSDGSHIAQPFDIVHGVPVLYSTGNFVFLTPGRFGLEFNGEKPPPFGMVVHAIFDGDSGKLDSLELHCTWVNNKKVDYKPRLCTPKQAKILFGELGKHVHHKKGDLHATVKLGSIKNKSGN